MVSKKSVEDQLKALKFNIHGWGRAEVKELAAILMPDEEIYECVNGMYEGGFALLVATDSRMLLVDKKPLNYLSVEDLRFDTISELDYSHRLIGARISVSAGSKNLVFKSYNQPRLRKLIGHVQHCMAETKKKESRGQENQKQHLEQINQQLQTYLIAQHQQQQDLRLQLEKAGISTNGDAQQGDPTVNDAAAKISPELSDYLFAQSLLRQYKEEHAKSSDKLDKTDNKVSVPAPIQVMPAVEDYARPLESPKLAELYADGVQEIYGRQAAALADHGYQRPIATQRPLEINALKIAYSKLPLALRNRKFASSLSFHASSQPKPATNQRPLTAQ